MPVMRPPIGVFRETAQGLLRTGQGRARDRSGDARREDLFNAIRLAQEECLAKGVTSFQDAGSSFELIVNGSRPGFFGNELLRPVLLLALITNRGLVPMTSVSV